MLLDERDIGADGASVALQEPWPEVWIASRFVSGQGEAKQLGFLKRHRTKAHQYPTYAAVARLFRMAAVSGTLGAIRG